MKHIKRLTKKGPAPADSTQTIGHKIDDSMCVLVSGYKCP